MAASMTTINATIVRVNGHGFQTREDPGRWFNVSKFQNPAPTIPPAGTEVTLTIDGSGFVRRIEQAFGNPAADAPGAAPGPETCRGALDTRLACLAAAAAFLAPRSEAKSADVLAMAEMFEKWAERA